MMKHEEIDPRYKDVLLNRMKTKAPFWNLLELEPVDVKKGWAQVKLPFRDKLLQPLNIVHGGAIFSLADSAAGLALLGMVHKDETFSTVEMKINFIRPFDAGEITATAEIVNRGKNIAIGDVDVQYPDGTLVARGLATFMIMKKTS